MRWVAKVVIPCWSVIQVSGITFTGSLCPPDDTGRECLGRVKPIALWQLNQSSTRSDTVNDARSGFSSGGSSGLTEAQKAVLVNSVVQRHAQDSLLQHHFSY